MNALLFSILPLFGGDEPTVSFDRDVRPILSGMCFECHGPDAKQRQARLRLDTREGMFPERKPTRVITPGDPQESELYLLITESDPEFRMPPEEFRHTLKPSQIDTIRRWIEQGAEYESHWAWPALKRPDVPSVHDSSWVRNPIDCFILARLEEEGVQPSPPASPRALARRLALDITGLPASAEQVAALQRGEIAAAEFSEQLLASPHYGERMAQHWLDLVRYADTVGYHGDQAWTMWPYRDYVIRSFQENQPFDEFTLEQLGGDLIEDASMTEKVAAAYNRLNMVTFEGGSQAKEFLLKYAADRVRNFSTVWLGSTVGCAECHDHKFDPYTMRDFYSLSAYFADIDEKGVFDDFQSRKVPPQMRVASEDQRARMDQAGAHIRALESAIDGDDESLSTAQAAWESTAGVLSKELVEVDWVDDAQGNGGSTEGTWTFVEGAEGAPVHSGSNSLRQEDAGNIQHFFRSAERTLRVQAGDLLFAWVHLDAANPPEELMLQFWVAGSWEHRVFWGADQIPYGGIGTDHEGHRPLGALPETGKWLRLCVDPALVGIPAGTVIGGMAFTQFGGLAHWDEAGVETRSPALALGAGDVDVVGILRKPLAKRSPEDLAALRAHFRSLTPLLEAERAELTKAREALAAMEEGLPQMLATVSVAPRAVRILPRGDWMDDSGEIVSPAAPAFLSQDNPASGARANRHDLGAWATSEENPLASRAFVNRIWKLFFGESLAKDPDDLGNQGARPTHPELLEWLAVEFVESGWDVKHIIRTILDSNTYRQSSHARPDLHDRDPHNELLARQSRWRLDAEFIRDGALQASGLLVKTVGGPSVKPYQPAGHWRELNFPMRTWEPDSGDSLYRRGLYTFWCRSFLHPAMDAFDAPSREESCARRNRSNTPQQALTLLNDPTFVEAARATAALALRASTDDTDRVHHIFQRFLARDARPPELTEALSLLRAEHARLAANPELTTALLSKGASPLPADIHPLDLASWTQVARLVLNLHETITRT